MNAIMPMRGGVGRVGLALAALISITAVATPATADDWNQRHYRYRHNDNGYFSFGFSSPGYYYNPPGYYYAPPPRYYYPPPQPYYPAPRYYTPGPSFNLVVPFGNHR